MNELPYVCSMRTQLSCSYVVMKTDRYEIVSKQLSTLQPQEDDWATGKGRKGRGGKGKGNKQTPKEEPPCGEHTYDVYLCTS